MFSGIISGGWDLLYICGSVFVRVVGVVAVRVDVVIAAAVDVVVEFLVFCHPDWRGCYFSVPQQRWSCLC